MADMSKDDKKRRARGEGGIHWDEKRQRWIATLTIGHTARGKRITRKASAKTETQAGEKLKQLRRDYEEGVSAAQNYTVEDAVRNWLQYGLNGRSSSTIEKNTILAEQHVIPDLGRRKLYAPLDKRHELSADDVDRWLAEKAKTHSTRTLQEMRAILKRSISRAQARDKARRNVVELCEVPRGKTGRPSKALTMDQAEAVLKAAEEDDSTIGAYVVVSLLTGARTEEMRPLGWTWVNLDGVALNGTPIPPHMMVWRSVRAGGDTKTRKSRRTVALPARCVKALNAQQVRQRAAREVTGKAWRDLGLVFASRVGTELDASHVRRAFRRITKKAGLNPADWTPRELRHSFVSLLSDNGVPLERIARLCGHSGTEVTELVYRHQIRPVIDDGATVMDRIFPQVEVSDEQP